MDAEKEKAKNLHWSFFAIVGLFTLASGWGLSWAVRHDNLKNYNRGYIDGQNSIAVKYSFHGTVQYIDMMHQSFTSIGEMYDHKLFETDNSYGCKPLTDTLRIELTTQPKK